MCTLCFAIPSQLPYPYPYPCPCRRVLTAYRLAAFLALLECGKLAAGGQVAQGGPVPSLYLLHDDARWPGGTLVASEPLDDAAGWRAVPPATLVRVDAGGVRSEPLSRC